jgi:cysteine desulfurase/selenocysteine lyase
MPQHSPITDYRMLFVGLDAQVPLLDGTQQTYINLDNAASTPALLAVQQTVDHFLTYYSSVHRGTGFKSQLATHAYEQSRHITLRFLGADPAEHTCIFVKNTTEAVNKLARRFPFTPEKDIVLTSGMEHHSNDLPWRAVAHTIHLHLTPDGHLDEGDFDAKLAQYGGRVALVALTGASNVTGIITPLHRLAEKAHRAGALIFADCAQFAPHRPVEMKALGDPTHLDFVAISAHKMYAPFGTGALVGRKDIFQAGDPDQRGGGTVEIVTLDDVVWAGPPDKEEAGSPNTVGAVALAAAITQLEQVGMSAVAAHEAELTAYALEKLPSVPGIQIYGNTDPAQASQRLGVLPLALQAAPHFLVAAILGHEFGIGVRSGCFCAHPYILHLLKLTSTEAHAVRDRMLAGDRTEMPGMTRVSFGLYNTLAEVDAFVHALTCIARGRYKGKYQQVKSTGEYLPAGWQPDFEEYFSF